MLKKREACQQPQSSRKRKHVRMTRGHALLGESPSYRKKDRSNSNISSNMPNFGLLGGDLHEINPHFRGDVMSKERLWRPRSVIHIDTHARGTSDLVKHGKIAGWDRDELRVQPSSAVGRRFTGVYFCFCDQVGSVRVGIFVRVAHGLLMPT